MAKYYRLRLELEASEGVPLDVIVDSLRQLTEKAHELHLVVESVSLYNRCGDEEVY